MQMSGKEESLTVFLHTPPDVLTGRLRKTHPAAVKQNKSVEIVCQSRHSPHSIRNVLTNRIHSMLTFGFDQLDRRQAFVKKKLDAFSKTLHIQS